MEKLKKGQRVNHTSRPDWGLGQLMEDENANEIRVFFPKKGEFLMQTADRDRLELVISVEPPLDIPPKIPPKKPGVKQKPKVTIDMDMAKERFLEKFPGGFYGKRLLDVERDYKVALSRVAHQLLGKDVLLPLMVAEHYQLVFENANDFIKYQTKITRNHFPSVFEKLKFRDGLKKLDSPQRFAHSFYEYLHGEGDLEPRFTRFAQVLEQMEADKWPIISNFRFFLFPATDVFIKPLNLQRAADVSSVEINYRPRLNWLTYHSVTKFYQHLRDNLTTSQCSELKLHPL
jgi:hypothetical protein